MSQTRQAIASLSQSLFAMFQQLGFTENKLDQIQEHLDALVSIGNDKTKDAVQEVVVSVDKDRRDRRKKEKSDKGKEKENVNVDQQPTIEPAVEPTPTKASKASKSPRSGTKSKQ